MAAQANPNTKKGHPAQLAGDGMTLLIKSGDTPNMSNTTQCIPRSGDRQTEPPQFVRIPWFARLLVTMIARFAGDPRQVAHTVLAQVQARVPLTPAEQFDRHRMVAETLRDEFPASQDTVRSVLDDDLDLLVERAAEVGVSPSRVIGALVAAEFGDTLIMERRIADEGLRAEIRRLAKQPAEAGSRG